jgi:DNA-directed RNA polymerase omega subunit
LGTNQFWRYYMDNKTYSKDLDIQKITDNVGGSRFELVLIAATRAREIANARTIAQRANPQLKYETKITTEALNEIEHSKIGREYLGKVRSAR